MASQPQTPNVPTEKVNQNNLGDEPSIQMQPELEVLSTVLLALHLRKQCHHSFIHSFMRSTFWTPLAAGDSNEQICVSGDRQCCEGKVCRVRVEGALLFCVLGSRTAFLTRGVSVKAESGQERATRTPEGHRPGQTPSQLSPSPVRGR